jgi:sugar O-acyltransferase (sialic acid O-acetyltransferase NeuD family)
MAKIILVAASGLAREVVESTRRAAVDEIIGVLDDNPMLAGTRFADIPVLGNLDTPVPEGTGLVVCAGKGSVRSAVIRRLAERGVTDSQYGVVVDPTAVIGSSCRVGPGSIVLAQVVLTADVEVGRHVVVMPQVTLTHDDQIGDFATICAGVSLGGRVEVGERAYLGMNASVRQDVVIGADSVLGMGSVLLSDLPAGQTWAGVPARELTGIAR